MAASKGIIGYHPSILPRYKGKNDIEDAINNGDITTGRTIYYFDNLFDTGDIILQDWCFISPADTTTILRHREFAPIASNLFKQFIK